MEKTTASSTLVPAAGRLPRRVLVTIHGREPAGWKLPGVRALLRSRLAPRSGSWPSPTCRRLRRPPGFRLPAAPEPKPASSGGDSRRRTSARRLETLLAGLATVPDVAVDYPPGRGPRTGDRRARPRRLGRRSDRRRARRGELARAAASRRDPRGGGRAGRLRGARHAAAGAGHAPAWGRRIRLRTRQTAGSYREGEGRDPARRALSLHRVLVALRGAHRRSSFDCWTLVWACFHRGARAVASGRRPGGARSGCGWRWPSTGPSTSTRRRTFPPRRLAALPGSTPGRWPGRSLSSS